VRRLFKDRRGVSPVFTTILLILLVVWGMSFLLAYFITYVKDFQTGRGSVVMELVCIEDVWFKRVGESSPIEIWLYNYGKVNVNVTALYIGGQPVPFNSPDNFLEIPVGQHGNVTTVYSLDPNKAYHFKVVTQRGAAYEGEYVSPS
jgi:flagellin-like protein